MEYFIDIIKVDEMVINKSFTYLLEDHNNYYEKQINRINTGLINNLAKLCINQYHLKYYATFNQLIKNNKDDRSEYDFYNMYSFDLFLENTEKDIKVFTEKDLKILKSILDIADIFLKNAINENNFESLINSFYKLKDKLELNNFVYNNPPTKFIKDNGTKIIEAEYEYKVKNSGYNGN